MQPPRRQGTEYEDLAADFLIRQGMTIITRRARAKGGELDLVALDGDELVFVEVKMRRAGVGPELAISREKGLRIQSAAKSYIHEHLIDRPFRYDVIAFAGSQVRHHKGVFLDFAELKSNPNDEFEAY
jgi:putative endonuclease